MADVASSLRSWSTTASSNSPSGATTIGTGLDDNLREIQAVVRADLASKGSDVTSATSTNLATESGLFHDITGTSTITGWGTVSAGIWKVVKFEGVTQLTHNATSLILPGGANITTADGDVAIFISEGSGNWRCISYEKASGGSLGPLLMAEQTTTSGTSVSVGSIPAWAKKITVNFRGVGTSGTSTPILQIGDSGGAESSGYTGTAASTDSSVASTTGLTSGFILVEQGHAADVLFSGSLVLTLQKASDFTWAAQGVIGGHGGNSVCTFVGGYKTLSAALDRIVLTTAGGSDTFDAGSISVLVE